MDIPQKFIFLVMSKACKSSRTRKMWSIGRRNRKQTNKQKLKCSMYPFTFLTERAEKKIELFPVKEMHWLGFGIVESVRNRASGEEAIEVGRGKLRIKLQMMFGFRARERRDWSDSEWIESNLLVVCQRKRWKAIKAIAFALPSSRSAVELGHVQPEFNWMANYVDWIPTIKSFQLVRPLEVWFHMSLSDFTLLYRRRSMAMKNDGTHK